MSGNQPPARHLLVSSEDLSPPRWLEAFPSASVLRPDDVRGGCVEYDIVWLRLQAGEALESQLADLRTRCGAAKIIVLSDQPNDPEVISSISLGARGYCNAHAHVEVLRQVAGVVMLGGLWIGESLLERVVAATAQLLPEPIRSEPASWSQNLSEREREVARLVAQGLSNKEIAQQLEITPRTVKAHVGAILEKLQVRDRLQIVLQLRR